MFQQRHFERLAETVRDAPVSEDERRRWASLLADSTGRTNSRFKRGKFLRACGVREV